VDDAALHHVFDGGWLWVLRFGNGVTSAGVALVDALAEELRAADGEAALAAACSIAFPPCARSSPTPGRPAGSTTSRASAIARRWRRAAMGAAAVGRRVHRPALLDRVSADAARHRAAGGAAGVAGVLDQAAPLEAYSATTLAEADHTAAFVAGCYAGFPRFDDFVQYSMFYFAAASYAEMARRVSPERAAAGFLRAADPVFASALRALSPRADARPAATSASASARRSTREHRGAVRTGEEELVCADAADAIAGAAKLGVRRSVAASLARSGSDAGGGSPAASVQLKRPYFASSHTPCRRRRRWRRR
jgi:FADH2 O2-dependent halogenase